MQAENVLMAGTGAVLSSGGRWGDYSSLSIDPVDDATFWFTTEYADGSNNWTTRIGEFAFDDSDVNIYATMSSDNILVRRNGINIEVFFDSQLVKSLAIATLNSLKIHGLGGNDTLTVDHSGGMIDPALTYKGDSGNDRIIVSGDYDYTLTDTLLVNPGAASVSLQNVEQAVLTGGAAGNTLDAQAFTSGSVTLDGTGGNDTLLGSAGNDLLIGGTGTNELRQTEDADQVLTNNQVTGQGTDVLSSIQRVVLTGGSGDNTLDASAFTLGLVTLSGLTGNDTLFGSNGVDLLLGGTGTDEIRQTANADQVLTDNQVTGDGPDVLSSIEHAVLTGGSGANTLDASAFTLGSVTLEGLAGDDSLFGSNLADSLDGGANDDLFVALAGNDTLSGGTGVDELQQTADADQVLTDNQVTGQGTDVLSSIEHAVLTGGNGDNTLDASAFTPGSVTLSGLTGNDTLFGSNGVDLLLGGTGTDEIRQTANADQVLTDNQVTGQGPDVLSSIEHAVLTGGAVANTLDASAFTLGSVTLEGLAGDDSLFGSNSADSLDGGANDDLFVALAGNDTLSGGTGVDELQQTADADQVLTDNQVTGQGTDVLSSIEHAVLTGGNGDNTLDASAFTLGSVTLEGLAGDDSLFGSSSADSLDGGDNDDLFVALAGNDTLSGGTGVDELQQTADADQVLTDNQVTGQGTDVLSSIEHAVLTGGGGDNTLDASAFTLGSVTLVGGDGNDTLTGTSISDTLDGGPGIDTGQMVFDGDLVLTDTTLIGLGSDTVIAIERFIISGGNGPNRIDASGYTLGSVTLDGGLGDDTLLGSAGDDSLIGGGGIDTIEQTIDGNQVLGDTSLQGMGTDSLSGFERADLTGGTSDNLIDAGSFTGLGVTLVGTDGDDTLLGSAGNDSLDGGDGTDLASQTVDADQVATNTSLSGHGNDVLADIEEIRLIGGTGNNSLDATAFSLGPVTLLAGDGNDTLSGSPGDDLLQGDGGTDVVHQVSGNDQVLIDTMLTGEGVDVLYGIENATLQGDNLANLIDASGFNVGPVTLIGHNGDDTLHGSPADDSLDGGYGIDFLVQVADADQLVTNTVITGHGYDSIASFERVRLTGGAGDNRLDASGFSIGLVTLDGAAGNDTLVGALFDDVVNGGDGTDLVEQTVDADQELTDGQLTGRGTDLLMSIESAMLTGGESGNLLSASGFTIGPVTLNGANGDDTLVPGLADDSINGGGGSDLVWQSVNTDQVLTNSLLTGQGNDILASVEQAELTGGVFGNRLDASAFTAGPVTLHGGAGNDTLLGSVTDDSLDGGTGFDQLEQTADTDQVLTSSSITGQGSDVLTSIERAVITGGASDNSLDALGFDSGNATLSGADGNDTLFGSPGDDLIDGGNGTDLVVSSGDVDQAISDSSINGVGSDVLVAIELAHLTGGDSANSLDASGFSGNTTLEGGDGDDTLLGGSGIDLVLQIADADQVLTTTSLTGLGQNTLDNIDQAQLVGGDSDNLLDATAFAPGPVTLDGADGDDTLHGSAGDDQLFGGDGTDRVVSTGTTNQVLTDNSLNADSDDTLVEIEEAELFGSGADNVLDATGFSGDTTLHGSPGDDTLAGGTGTDLVRQTVDANQSLSDSQLTGQGTDQLSGIELAWLTGGSNDNTINAQDFSAGPVTLDGASGDDTLVGGSGDDCLVGGDGTDQVQQSSENHQLLTNSLLTGEGSDLLEDIEEAQLSGGSGDNLLDATAFSVGSVTLSGLTGDDTLRGSAGDDSLVGGDGTDRVEQTTDSDQALTNSLLTGRGTDQLDGVETAHLVGGSGDNQISASSFTLGPVTLDGAAGDDNLTGGSQGDSIIGSDGDDVANGRGGDDLISGGNGNDVFRGGSGGDTLEGDSGDDTLSGQGGRDQIYGSDGNDQLDGGGSPDTVVGGQGHDWILGGSSGDVLNGSSGNDSVDGGSGSDRIFGGSGADTLEGGSGEDRLNGQGGSGDVVNGNDGDDTVRGGTGNDLLDGGNGYDELREGGDADYLLLNNSLSGQGLDVIVSFETARLSGGGGANQIDSTGFSGPVTLRGSGGDDLLMSAGYDDLLLGGNGNDTLDSGLGLDTLNGGAGIDRIKTSGDGDFVITDTTVSGPMTGTLIGIEAADITGGVGDNVLDASGFSGDTTLWGGGGRDMITGGIGNDWLNGNDGEDVLEGGGGADLIHGGEGADVMVGGDGDDTLNGEAGDDTIDGGAGDDQLIGEDGRDRLLGRDGDDVLYGGPGHDQLIGHSGNDRLNGEAGNDILLGDEGADALWGGNGNDVISGDDDNDRLFGQAGNDTLLGGVGNDQLRGGSARDVLQGGDDDDTLNGESGHDTLGGGDGQDRINPHDNSMVVNELFALPAELFEAIEDVRNQ